RQAGHTGEFGGGPVVGVLHRLHHTEGVAVVGVGNLNRLAHEPPRTHHPLREGQGHLEVADRTRGVARRQRGRVLVRGYVDSLVLIAVNDDPYSQSPTSLNVAANEAVPPRIPVLRISVGGPEKRQPL